MVLLEPRDEVAIKEYLDAQAKGEDERGPRTECQVEGCPMPIREGDGGYCQTHARQVAMFGKTISPPASAE